MINTYNLTVLFDGYYRQYYNISRVAVKRFVEYHRENQDYEYHYVNESLTSH